MYYRAYFATRALAEAAATAAIPRLQAQLAAAAQAVDPAAGASQTIAGLSMGLTGQTVADGYSDVTLAAHNGFGVDSAVNVCLPSSIAPLPIPSQGKIRVRPSNYPEVALTRTRPQWLVFQISSRAPGGSMGQYVTVKTSTAKVSGVNTGAPATMEVPQEHYSNFGTSGGGILMPGSVWSDGGSPARYTVVYKQLCFSWSTKTLSSGGIVNSLGSTASPILWGEELGAIPGPPSLHNLVAGSSFITPDRSPYDLFGAGTITFKDVASGKKFTITDMSSQVGYMASLNCPTEYSYPVGLIQVTSTDGVVMPNSSAFQTDIAPKPPNSLSLLKTATTVKYETGSGEMSILDQGTGATYTTIGATAGTDPTSQTIIVPLWNGNVGADPTGPYSVTVPVDGLDWPSKLISTYPYRTIYDAGGGQFQDFAGRRYTISDTAGGLTRPYVANVASHAYDNPTTPLTWVGTPPPGAHPDGPVSIVGSSPAQLFGEVPFAPAVVGDPIPWDVAIRKEPDGRWSVTVSARGV